MLAIHTQQVADMWFGICCAGEALVATAVRSTRASTVATLRRSVPPGVECRIASEDPLGHLARTIGLLVELEAGDETHKAFSLASEYIPQPLARVLEVAATIPLGYVTSYGNIARASEAEAREVGAAMASNPLYPIVPCHRVVGADLSLVGYKGSKGREALRAKLQRLSREVRGFAAERSIPAAGRPLCVYPVEWAIAKTQKDDVLGDRQGRLFE